MIRWPALGLTAAAAIFCLAPSDAAWQALPRLLVAACAVLLLPGAALLRCWPLFPEQPHPAQRLLLAFSASYVLVTGLCVATTLVQGSLAAAAWLLLAGTALAFALPERRVEAAEVEPLCQPAAELRGTPLLVVIPLLLVAFYCWVAEPPVGGEEVVELISVRKILESPRVTLDGILHRPKAVPTYLFAPYAFTVALVTRLSGLDMLVAYVKLRLAYAALALLGFYCMARRLMGESFALAALAGLALLLVTDPDPWSFPASLLPLVRRGSFAAGVIMPALVWLILNTSLRARRGAELLAPALLLLAQVMTHALEAVFSLYFAAGCGAATWMRPSWKPFRRRALAVLGLMLASLLAYRAVHHAVVTHVAAYEAARQTGSLAGRSLFGRPGEAERYLISASGAAAVYSVFPLLLLPLLPTGPAALLWASSIPPLAVHTSPLLHGLLVRATTPEIRFAGGYFGLLGVLAFLALVFQVARRFHRGPVAALLVSGLAALPLAWGLTALGVAEPRAAVGLGLVGGGVLGRWRTVPRRREISLMVFLCLCLPVFVGMKAFPGPLEGSRRADMIDQLIGALDDPSVTDPEAYYPVLQRTARPAVDLPREVVEDLRQVLPPLQVLVYDPEHSYSVPLLLNQYIVNPGFLLSTDMAYFEEYVEDGVHPLYNHRPVLTGKERRFLKEYEVDYALVNPRWAKVLREKLREFPLVYQREGFLLYRVRRPETPGRG